MTNFMNAGSKHCKLCMFVVSNGPQPNRTAGPSQLIFELGASQSHHDVLSSTDGALNAVDSSASQMITGKSWGTFSKSATRSATV